MALRKTLTSYHPTSRVIKQQLDDDVDQVEKTIIRIVHIEGDKREVRISTAHFNEDSGAYVGGANESFVPNLAEGAPNFLAQAYAHLKTLPAFADAEDY